MSRLRERGFLAVLAGGCVRDACLGRPVRDFDIATAARPQEVESVFPQTVPVGKAFGVMLVVVDGVSIEVATFRRDGPYRDGRHPESVEFADLKEDAARRDFTINALFYDAESDQVVDLIDGLADLTAGVIRAVGNAAERFNEDSLRILRAVRFAAQLGFKIDPQTWSALIEKRQRLTQVSAERQWHELKRLAESEHAATGWRLLQDAELLPILVPELKVARSELAQWLRALRAIGELIAGCPAAIALGWLFFALRRDPRRLKANLQRLKSSRDEVQSGVRLHAYLGEFLNPATRLGRRIEILGAAEGPWVAHFALPASAWYAPDSGLAQEQIQSAIDSWRSVCRGGSLPPPLIRGEDLISLGLPKEPRFGVLLKELYWLQLETGWGRDELLAQIPLAAPQPC